jgi:hypothetical protein
VTSRLDQNSRMVAIRGRDARQSSKKGQIEHDRGDTLVTVSQAAMVQPSVRIIAWTNSLSYSLR